MYEIWTAISGEVERSAAQHISLGMDFDTCQQGVVPSSRLKGEHVAAEE